MTCCSAGGLVDVPDLARLAVRAEQVDDLARCEVTGWLRVALGRSGRCDLR